MVGRTRWFRKRSMVRFADAPWNGQSDEWQVRDEEVPAEHVAREVVEAVRPVNVYSSHVLDVALTI